MNMRQMVQISIFNLGAIQYQNHEQNRAESLKFLLEPNFSSEMFLDIYRQLVSLTDIK